MSSSAPSTRVRASPACAANASKSSPAQPSASAASFDLNRSGHVPSRAPISSVHPVRRRCSENASASAGRTAVTAARKSSSVGYAMPSHRGLNRSRCPSTGTADANCTHASSAGCAAGCGHCAAEQPARSPEASAEVSPKLSVNSNVGSSTEPVAAAQSPPSSKSSSVIGGAPPHVTARNPGLVCVCGQWNAASSRNRHGLIKCAPGPSRDRARDSTSDAAGRPPARASTPRRRRSP
jgi:hypothetical protein